MAAEAGPHEAIESYGCLLDQAFDLSRSELLLVTEPVPDTPAQGAQAGRGGANLIRVAAPLRNDMGAALGSGKLLNKLVFGVSASDPLTLGVVAVTLAVVALIANLVPAYRASRLDPQEVLRAN